MGDVSVGTFELLEGFALFPRSCIVDWKSDGMDLFIAARLSCPFTTTRVTHSSDHVIK